VESSPSKKLGVFSQTDNLAENERGLLFVSKSVEKLEGTTVKVSAKAASRENVTAKRVKRTRSCVATGLAKV